MSIAQLLLDSRDTPMARLIVGSYYEVRFVSRMNDQVGINVRHYLCDNGSATLPTEEEFADHLSANVGPEYRALMTNLATYNGVVVRRITPIPPGPPVVNTNGAGPGAAGAVAAPAQVSGLISLTTQFAGKSQRGRVYVPFPASQSIETDGRPNAPYRTALAALRDEIIATRNLAVGGNTAVMVPVIYSRKYVTRTPVLNGLVRDRFATQRSRGHYGAPNPLITP